MNRDMTTTVPQRFRDQVAAKIAGTPDEGRLDEIVRLVAAVLIDGEHLYLSTSCLHGDHASCHVCVRADGTLKNPAQCKFCPSMCVCDCHV